MKYLAISCLLAAGALIITGIGAVAKRSGPAAHTTQDLVGKKFPILKGKALNGDEVEFPKVTKGKVALLSIAFIQSSQSKIDSWTTPLEGTGKLLSTTPGLEYYEIPLMPSHNSFVRFMANNGMRSGIPKAKHSHVVCYYGDQKPYFKALGSTQKTDAFFLVLDKEGIVRYKQEGFATLQNLAAVKGLVVDLLKQE